MELNLLTAERLREILEYDPETGVFTWRARPAVDGETKKQAAVRKAWNTQWAGKPVGVTVSNDPWTVGRKSRMLRIAGKYYGEHRVVWAWMTGAWPKEQIDHIDGDSIHNKFENLREASHGQNQCNKGPMKNNRLGIKGVGYRESRKSRKKFYAQINWAGKVRHLGWFETADEASRAYRSVAEKLHGEFLHKSQKTVGNDLVTDRCEAA